MHSHCDSSIKDLAWGSANTDHVLRQYAFGDQDRTAESARVQNTVQILERGKFVKIRSELVISKLLSFSAPSSKTTGQYDVCFAPQSLNRSPPVQSGKRTAHRFLLPSELCRNYSGLCQHYSQMSFNWHFLDLGCLGLKCNPFHMGTFLRTYCKLHRLSVQFSRRLVEPRHVLDQFRIFLTNPNNSHITPK